MRARTSLYSHEARSDIASASRELRISPSIVSSSTSVSGGCARLEGRGRSPGRAADTPPASEATRTALLMPICQPPAPAFSDSASSRRANCAAPAEGCDSSSRAALSMARTRPGRPFNKASV